MPVRTEYMLASTDGCLFWPVPRSVAADVEGDDGLRVSVGLQSSSCAGIFQPTIRVQSM